MNPIIETLKRKNSRILLLIGIFGILAVAVTVSIAAGPSIPPPPDTLPAGSNPEPPPELSRAEKEAIDDAWEKAQREGNPNVAINERFTVRVVSGPATRGMTLEIAGKTLTLPDDAELGGLSVASGLTYNIMRGDGLARVSASTGEFRISDGDRSVFQILFDTFGEENYKGTVNEIESGDCSADGDSGRGDCVSGPDAPDSPKGPPVGAPSTANTDAG